MQTLNPLDPAMLAAILAGLAQPTARPYDPPLVLQDVEITFSAVRSQAGGYSMSLRADANIERPEFEPSYPEDAGIEADVAQLEDATASKMFLAASAIFAGDLNEAEDILLDLRAAGVDVAFLDYLHQQLAKRRPPVPNEDEA